MADKQEVGIAGLMATWQMLAAYLEPQRVFAPTAREAPAPQIDDATEVDDSLLEEAR